MARERTNRAAESPAALEIGMRRRDAFDALGLPFAINRSVVGYRERQEWVFQRRQLHLYFDGDYLAAWHHLAEAAERAEVGLSEGVASITPTR